MKLFSIPLYISTFLRGHIKQFEGTEVTHM